MFLFFLRLFEAVVVINTVEFACSPSYCVDLPQLPPTVQNKERASQVN